MHLLVINGSPRGENSNTQRLVGPFLEGALGKGATGKTIFTANLRITDCQGCFSCWSRTPGQCPLQDDMPSVLQEMAKADAIIWASPLYHFGITASLKRVIERTLPLALPEIRQDAQGCYHPPRGSGIRPRHLWILNCGFPDSTHFDAVRAHMKALDLAQRTHEEPSQGIFCTAGEILRRAEAKPLWSPYLEVVKQCGAEFVETGRISEETLQKTSVPYIHHIPSFIEHANRSWTNL